jgi:hypothetical protein
MIKKDLPSFPRKWESRVFQHRWIPAFAHCCPGQSGTPLESECPRRLHEMQQGATSFLAATTSPARHPGAGRDPVATTLVQAARQMDSGLRRNDEQKRDGDARCKYSRLFRTAVRFRRNDEQKP